MVVVVVVVVKWENEWSGCLERALVYPRRAEDEVVCVVVVVRSGTCSVVRGMKHLCSRWPPGPNATSTAGDMETSKHGKENINSNT